MRLGISVDTIRRWEKRGIVRSERDALNRRVFSPDELTRIMKKKETRRAGVQSAFEVLLAPKSIYSAVELFAGGGGTALGMHNAGISHLVLNEWDKYACETLRRNFPGVDVREGDISQMSFSEFRGKADILQGGVPCQAFSYAGKSLGFEDTRGTLFFDFARAVDEVKPKIFVMENVRGLLSHDGGRTLQVMLNIMRGLGYKVTAKVLRAQFFDVAQKRERLILLGVRADLNIPLLLPVERDYIVSLGDALAGCPESPGATYPEAKRKVLEMVPPGGYWRDLPDEMQREFMGGSYHLGGGKTGMARRLSWDEPSLTLTCSPAQKQTERCHPEETRPLTVREYARVQSFPDSWEFQGSIASQYKQIGNAVPVNLAFHIGRALVAMLSGRGQDGFREERPLTQEDSVEDVRRVALRS